MMNEKEKKLRAKLAEYQQVIVGFSGGIDSTVVLAEAVQVLGRENVLAVVANSELFADAEYERAVALAKELGVAVEGVRLDYLSETDIANNTPNSWYAMKKIFYQALNQIAAQHKDAVVLDGMIMDDVSDFRPGLRARDEEGAISVLQQADLYKDEVRQIAQKLNLTNWNKVASCSVSSRFPYYTELTSEKIKKVMTAEAYLRSIGYLTVRVRVYNDIADIEVPIEQLSSLVAQSTTVFQKLQAIGYQHVTLDLQGFESGRMNQTLSETEKSRALVG
ncbi:ATP-dependent sacrificial sulfur transferase LarE [Latilactobacillus graminis]|uniref:PP family ATPase n=2 Tax=Latilactobacillus graminis TaxID=60519 RepID=A0AA89I5L1_9LACO|nr:ATP-dependent sacrificial sulfur transferase LarE [Latilactobacillus graminis]KRM23629.1 PP family ATPase [Latilactobacillus graminis DSM 20719]QFP80178.1 ATP-dependent sacrificial sulfur transferase LarE [Latilactobacillus graminis]